MPVRCAPRARKGLVPIDTTETAAAPERDLTPEELIVAMEESLRDFNDGDIVEGTVVKIDRDEVLLDIGYKSEGVIPSKELSIRHDVDPNEVVKVGDKVEALVLQKEDKEGRLILSKKRAQYERAWGRIEEVMRSGETITGPGDRGRQGRPDPRHRICAASCPRRSSTCAAFATCIRSSVRSWKRRSSSSIATATTSSCRAARSWRSRSPRVARSSSRGSRRASAARGPSARS